MTYQEQFIVGRVLRGEDEKYEVVHVHADRSGLQVFGREDTDPAYTVP